MIHPALTRLSRLKQARAATIVTVACAVLAVFLVQNLSFLTSADQYIVDLETARYAPAEPQDPDIVIVAVTEETLAQFPYRAPVDREFLAGLVATLAAKNPRAIGVDFLFDQPTEPDKDAALGRAIAETKVPLRIAYTETDTVVSDSQRAYLKSFVPPARRALVNLATDQFDVVRWIYPGAVTSDGHYVMGFSRSLADAVGVKTPAEQVPLGWRGKPANGDPTFLKVPAHFVKVLAGNPQWSEKFKNKIVLIGSDLTLVDRHRSPFSTISADGAGLAGVEIQAYALSQLLHGRSSPVTTWKLDLLVALLMAAIGVFLGRTPSHLALRFGGGLLLVGGFWLGDVLLFHVGGPLGGPVAPALSLAMAFFAMEAISGSEARAQRKFIESVFSRHVAPEVVGQILNDPARMTSLEGERRVMTFLFTDVADFTTLSESVDAKQLGPILNEYLEVMTDLVQKHGGMVDKFIGDAVVAIFNAPIDLPDHAEAAVRCALEMDRFCKNFSAGQKAAGIAFGKTRIGVHTGAAMVGNFGSRTRHNYTASGDAVNTAARLEGLNKHFGTNISVSGATRGECRTISFRPTASVVLKGKTTPIEVWEPLQAEEAEGDFLARYGEAYAMLKMGSKGAVGLLEGLARDRPGDPCVTFHLQRVRQGVFGDTVVMTEK